MQESIEEVIDQLQRLKAENEHWKEMFDALPQTVFETDERGFFTYLNNEAYHIFGYDKSNHTITHPLQTIHPSYVEIAKKNMSDILNGVQAYSHEYLVQKSDGTAFFAIIHSTPIYKAGSICGLRGIVFDISERKKIEEELRNTQIYLKTIINNLNSAIMTVDNSLKLLEWNIKAEELLFIDESKHARDIFELLPFLYYHKQNITNCLKNHETEYLKKVKTELSSKKILNISIIPIIKQGTQGLMIKIDDVTELESKNEQLIQAQKMESIGNLTGGIAHDFNNILSGLVGTISLLKFKLSDNSEINNNEFMKYIMFMEQSSKRAVDMIQSLLTLSKKRDINLAPVDLNHSLKMIMKICQNTFEKSVVLSPFYLEEPAIVFADATQIEQVLLNLCINAYHAMTIMQEQQHKQGGTLSVSFEMIKADDYFLSLHSQARLNEEYWKIMVGDTGVGIPEQIKSKIFDPFYTTKDKSQGSGLGLSMVYSIIEQHKGFVSLYSEVNQGTVFNVFLPVYKFNLQEEDIVLPHCLVKGFGTILLADDEFIIRELGKNFLEECGYRVILASDGQDCLIKFREHIRDIRAVVLDMIMPIKSGNLVFHELKSMNPEIKILLSSGFKNDYRVEELLRSGADGFIQKPYTLEQLSSVISKIL